MKAKPFLDDPPPQPNVLAPHTVERSRLRISVTHRLAIGGLALTGPQSTRVLPRLVATPYIPQLAAAQASAAMRIARNKNIQPKSLING
jgi:hypothetical protein